MDWKSIVSTVAPWIGTALGGLLILRQAAVLKLMLLLCAWQAKMQQKEHRHFLKKEKLFSQELLMIN